MADEIEGLTKGENTRSLILTSAEDHFLANGYHGTSMRQIAHGARGMAVGGLYNHFQSKEEIFCELLQERTPWKEMLEIFLSIDGEDGTEMLHEAFLQLQVLFHSNLPFTILLLVDMRELGGQNTRILAEKVYPGIIDFLTRVNERGGIREDISILTVLRSFAGMMIGYLMTQFLGSSLIGSELEYTLPNLQQTLYDSTDMIDAMFYGIASPRKTDNKMKDEG